MNPTAIVQSESSIGWMASGLCRGHDPSFFFPDNGSGVVKAQKVCRNCPVQADCLQHALDHQIDHGVWGGTSERQRRRIRRNRETLELRPAS